MSERRLPGSAHALTPPEPDSLLLELPVPFRRIDGVLHVEAQAHNGIARWLDNFRALTICAPTLPETLLDASSDWRPVDTLEHAGRLSVHVLPWGYHPRDHQRHRREVRDLFRRLIPLNQYLCFSNLGWAGAWGNIAAAQARRAGRPYAVWLDWELHATQHGANENVFMRTLREWRRSLERRSAINAIRHAELGLFHGRTVYDAYRPISRNPHVVHNIHLKRSDLIDEARLQAKLEHRRSPLRIGYVGRVHEMKGPLDWVAAVAEVARSDETADRIEAVWLGDGPLLEQARAEVRRQGLEHAIRFPGGERDRAKVLEFLRSLDLFVFCHNTPESPRCLIEALMSGVPIVGYDSAFARDLLDDGDGGQFVAIGDVGGLAAVIAELADDASLLRRHALAARQAGTHFSDDAVFSHRSELIRRYLPA